jgi:hypothetical protein
MTTLTIDRGFNSKLADKIGLTKAIIIHQIDYWLHKTNNVYEGKKWVYNSLKDWHKQDFHFLSLNAMINNFKALEKMGLLITGSFNKLKIDRTKWYTINYEKLAELIDEKPNEQSESTKPIKKESKVVAIYQNVQAKSAKKAFTKNKDNHLPKNGKWKNQELVEQYHKTTQEITHKTNNTPSANKENQPTKSNKRYYEQFKKNKQKQANNYYGKKIVEKGTDWSKKKAKKVNVDINAMQKFFADFENNVFSGQLKA